MLKKRLTKKAQKFMSYKFLIKILIIIVVAGILFLMIRRIGNAFLPQ